MVSTLEQMQVPNGTGPGVRRSKRPLLASRTRCNVLWKPPKFGNKVKIGNKVQFGNRFANWCNAWSIEGVIVYGHVPECHVTFGRGRLHNVWWDPHIDHKTKFKLKLKLMFAFFLWEDLIRINFTHVKAGYNGLWWHFVTTTQTQRKDVEMSFKRDDLGEMFGIREDSNWICHVKEEL